MTTVLLLEDNAALLKVIRLMLEESGYKVVSGRSAEEGWRHLEDASLKPDVILSDMVMPSVDGMHFLEHIRSTQELSATPFIMMSAFGSAEMQQKAFQLGADAFLSKPFQFETLNTVLRNLGVPLPAGV